MKFVYSVLLFAFAAPVSAFVAPTALRLAAVPSTVSQLSMIATGEMLNGETKKKTREVSTILLLLFKQTKRRKRLSHTHTHIDCV